MKTDKILQSDVLDIIFENRNKNYGAYALRKFYNNRLYKAFGGTMFVVIVLCSFTLMKPALKPVDDIPAIPITLMRDLADKPKEKIVEPEKDKPQEHKKSAPVATEKFTNLKITKNPNIEPIKNLNSDTHIGNIEIKIPSGGLLLKVGEVPSLKKDTIAKVGIVKPVIDNLTPTYTADIMPEYPGGMAALRKFLEKNLQNPQDLEEGQNVSVKIKFIVGYDGKLKGFETVEDGGTAFNEEVMRVLKKMPTWVPGKMAGEAVSVYYIMPVKFVPGAE